MKKLIIFDLDDTLCDYYSAKENAIDNLTKKIERKGIDSKKFWSLYKEKEPILFRKFVAQKISVLEYRKRRYKDMLVELGYDGDVDTFSDELNDDYIRITNEEVKLFPETNEVLEKLRKKYILAILTNGPLDGQTKKIEKFGLQNEVDKVYYSTKIGVGKPAKEAFEFVLNDLKINRKDAVMIGDSLRDDYQGAEGVGISAILLQRHKEKWNENFEGNRIHVLTDLLTLDI